MINCSIKSMKTALINLCTLSGCSGVPAVPESAEWKDGYCHSSDYVQPWDSRGCQ